MKSKSQHPCPHCQNDDDSMLEEINKLGPIAIYRCDVCSKTFLVKRDQPPAVR